VLFVEQGRRPVHSRATDLRALDVGDMNIDRIARRHHFDGMTGHARKRLPRIGKAARRLVVAADRFRVRPVPDIPLALGSQFTSLPRALAAEIVAAHRSGWFDFLRDAYAADELAVPTFVYANGWGASTQRGGMEPLRSSTLAGLANFHYLLPSMTGEIGLGQLAMAKESGRFFARKLNLDASPEMEDLLLSKDGP
jgi:hypothetical protein